MAESWNGSRVACLGSPTRSTLLCGANRGSAVSQEGPRSSLLCLVFTDLVDSTALKARIGDAAAGELMTRYHRDTGTDLGQW